MSNTQSLICGWQQGTLSLCFDEILHIGIRFYHFQVSLTVSTLCYLPLLHLNSDKLICITNVFSEIKMSANSTLEHILKEILEVLKPKNEDWRTRDQVIKEVRSVVKSVPSLGGNLYFHGSVKRIFLFYFIL